MARFLAQPTSRAGLWLFPLAFTLHVLVARVMEDHQAYLLYRADLEIVPAGSA